MVLINGKQKGLILQGIGYKTKIRSSKLKLYLWFCKDSGLNIIYYELYTLRNFKISNGYRKDILRHLYNPNNNGLDSLTDLKITYIFLNFTPCKIIRNQYMNGESFERHYYKNYHEEILRNKDGKIIRKYLSYQINGTNQSDTLYQYNNEGVLNYMEVKNKCKTIKIYYYGDCK